MSLSPERFVGRSDALANLAVALDSARRAVVTGTLILGPAGIGKSALAARVTALARDDGALVAAGRAPELTGAPPFWPWICALEELSLDPVAAPLVAAALEGLRPAGDGVPSASLRFVQFDAVRRALCSVASDRIVVVSLDDVHRADASTLLLASFLVRHTTRARLLFLFAARDAPGECPTPETAALVGELATLCTTVTLAGIDTDEARAMCEDLVGRSLPPEALSRLLEATGGNPFFLRETLLAARHDGVLDALGAGTLPLARTVRDAIHNLVARLGERTQRIFRSAAILGRASPVALVARVAEVTDASVYDALAEARAMGLCRAEPEGVFTFVHALVCEAIARDLAPSSAMELHAAAASAWETYTIADEGLRQASIAHHAHGAAPLSREHRSRALTASVHSGGLALRTLAWEAAAGAFETALSLADDATPAERIAMLIPLCRAATAAGRPELARTSLAQALALVEALGDPSLFAEVALVAAASREFMLADHGKLRLLERAAEGIASERTTLRVRVHSRLARDLGMDPSTRSRRGAIAQEAVDLARSLGDSLLYARALDARLHSLYSPENLTERAEYAPLITEAAGRAGDLELEVAGLAWQLSTLIETGALSEAATLARRHEALAEATGAVGSRINALSRLAALAFAAGRWDEGLALARSARQLGIDAGDPTAELLYAAQVAYPSVLRGNIAAAIAVLPALEAGIARAYTARLLTALVAWVRLHDGQRDEARRAFGVLASTDFTDVPQDFVRLATLCLLADLAANLGDTARARLLLPLLSPYSDRNAAAGTSFLLGPVSLWIAKLHRVHGETEAPRSPLVSASLLREGDGWVLSAGGASVRLKHQRGFELLRDVVRAEGAEVHALDLAGGAPSPEREALRAEGGNEVADARAIAEVRARLRSLDSDIDEAEESHDLGRAERLREERDALMDYARSAVGLGGRSRRTGETVERARVAVTVALGRAVKALEAAMPAVGQHLRVSLRTGATCRYAPDPSSTLRVTM